jgi:hypothetical protein
MSSNGQSISKTVDGVSGGVNEPTLYNVPGSSVSVAFQKKSDQGTLIVEILKDNKIVASSSTQAAYGVVSVATS